MLSFHRDESLSSSDIPFGVVEARYPDRALLRTEEFYALAGAELERVRAGFPDYERKAVFADNPYVRFFKKFKKTWPVLLQFESVVIKGEPFRRGSAVTAVPFLLELTTRVLSGTHDCSRVEGEIELYLSAEKTAFPGLYGREAHTYPGDFCARDAGGIVFSEIAGAEARSAAREDSTWVFYPLFGVPGLPAGTLDSAAETLSGYIKALSPEAEIEYARF